MSQMHVLIHSCPVEVLGASLQSHMLRHWLDTSHAASCCDKMQRDTMDVRPDLMVAYFVTLC